MRVPLLADRFPAVSPSGIDLETLASLDVAGRKNSSGAPDVGSAAFTRLPVLPAPRA